MHQFTNYLNMAQQYWREALGAVLALAYLYGLFVGGKSAYSLWSTLCKGVTAALFSFTAPFVMLIGMWTVRKDSTSLPSWLYWYDTPDEPELVGLYEPAVQKLWNIWWRLAVYDWFGFRNRAHGFTQLFSKESLSHWEEGVGSHRSINSAAWLNVKQFGILRTYFGWQVYYTQKYASGLEYRPMFSVKVRRG